MRPDRVLALCATAGVLALTGMDGLEVVDVAVGLVEFAVVVEVVAIPDVELGEVGVDLAAFDPSRDCVGVPGVARVLDELPGAAEVLDGVVAVGRGVARDLDPAIVQSLWLPTSPATV